MRRFAISSCVKEEDDDDYDDVANADPKFMCFLIILEEERQRYRMVIGMYLFKFFAPCS